MTRSLASFSFLALAAAGACPLAQAGPAATITVSHGLDIARPSETIVLPWSEINRALPGALIQRIAVRDAAGRVLPYQVTNIAPLAKDPKNVGIAYGELIFQHNFAAGEKRAIFTVEKIDTVAPPFPVKAFARFVPERLDDFAWENDKLAHRTYGPALGAPVPAGGAKEVLVTSGLDIWFKRVPYPVVDRWYNKGHDHYHKDEGEGMDMYNVGKTRGAGGTGVWDGKLLYTGNNFTGWKVLANGPVRAIFELSYDSWDAGGTPVSEVKRFTVDAGHYLDRIESTFTFAGKAGIEVGVGLNKTPTDKGQVPDIKIGNKAPGILMQWVEQASNGAMGTAVILPSATGFGEDALNHLVLAPAASGKPLRYYAGAAWSRSGDIQSGQDWERYLVAAAARDANPVTVSVATTP
ncbi:DUF4861 domain-containing protein [Massilia sp. CCM 8734]|uniref:DUF4861 domain-containing protein n=1 Tax=Massilia sp. CCM 8734 TaxID=2609283 RepID=UPI00141EBB39|nr:DUF4861 domain-containing protein [Massilia sp. CCM 8734]NHZ99517.1 DUF4861 domain-containing protein [Massilia sp. CCM 8734]